MRRDQKSMFFTVINCIDGRVQLPVITYLQKRFNIRYVNSITEPGPNLILAERKDVRTIASILKKIDILLCNRPSIGIAVVGHADCAGNQNTDDVQQVHIQKAMQFLGEQYKTLNIIGLWVDDCWNVNEVCC